jgi:hypothetical protein
VSYELCNAIAVRDDSNPGGEGPMRRGNWVWLLSLVVSGCMPAGAEIGAGGSPAISADMVPDPKYHPQAGDRAVLYAIDNGYTLDRLPVLKDMTSYDIYVRSLHAGDSDRLFDLEKDGWLQWVSPGTRVLILEMHDRNHAGAQSASKIKLPDSLQKDQVFWAPAHYITRLIRKEPD